MKKFLLLFCFLFLATKIFAQKNIADQHNTWLMYQCPIKLSSKFGVQADYEFRRHGWGETWQQSALRTSIDYFLNSNVIITVGHVWVKSYPYGKQPIKHETDEQRIWEQIILKHQTGRFYINHRYRAEQRFIENMVTDNQGIMHTDGFLFRERFRYRVTVNVPLNKKTMENKTLSLVVANEFFVNYGKGVGKNVYDQNRFSAGFLYQFNNILKVQANYLNQYILKADGIRAERNHTLQISIVSAFDFRKKEEKK